MKHMKFLLTALCLSLTFNAIAADELYLVFDHNKDPDKLVAVDQVTGAVLETEYKSKPYKFALRDEGNDWVRVDVELTDGDGQFREIFFGLYSKLKSIWQMQSKCPHPKSHSLSGSASTAVITFE